MGKRHVIRISVGEPVATILEAANEGEETRTLVAVDSRGFGPIGRLRLGSVSTKALRVAKGPVLVYPREAV